MIYYHKMSIRASIPLKTPVFKELMQRNSLNINLLQSKNSNGAH